MTALTTSSGFISFYFKGYAASCYALGTGSREPALASAHPASNTGTLYTGVTGYLADRIKWHKMDSFEGFTKKYKVRRLVYYESYEHVMTAIRREKQLKGWRREKKIALIEKMNPRWEDLSENWGREMRFRGQSIKRTP